MRTQFCDFMVIDFSFMGIRVLITRLSGDLLSFLQRKESRQRNAARLTQAFILNSKIKVPSSVLIFVAAAELTN